MSTANPIDLQPGESPQQYAERLGVRLNQTPEPAPEPARREINQADGQPPVELRTESPAAPPALDAERVQALAVATALRSPDAICLDDAIGWVEANDRDRSVIAAKAAVWDAERRSSSLSTGGPGSLKTARKVVEAALEPLAKVLDDAAAERGAVDASKRLSAVGKADEHEKINAKLAADIAAALAEPFDRAAELAREYESARGRDYGPAVKQEPKPPTAVDWAKVQALTLAKRSGNDADRLGTLTESCLAAGALLEASLVHEVNALVSADPLKLRLATLRLRQRTDARRAQLLSDPKKLDAAVRVAVARRVQDRLRMVRRFVEANPSEYSLARQEIAKAFPGLDEA